MEAFPICIEASICLTVAGAIAYAIGTAFLSGLSDKPKIRGDAYTLTAGIALCARACNRRFLEISMDYLDVLVIAIIVAALLCSIWLIWR